MKTSFAAFGVGYIFAIGLVLSGMTQPQKVVGFLDLFGHWDPSLIFVMGGAVAVHLLTYKLIRKRKSPLLSTVWHVPTKKELTPALILGSFLFGVGWALGGYCPGPALTALVTLNMQVIQFIIAMIAGMYLYKIVDLKFKIQK